MNSSLFQKNNISFKTAPEQLHRSFFITENKVSFINFIDLTQAEAHEVLRWRNDPQIRNHMYSKGKISWESHLQFLKNLPNQTKKFYWVVKEGEDSIGVIDIVDFRLPASEWGFYLNPDFVGTGKSINLIFHALNFFFKTLKFEGLFGFCHYKNTKALLFHDVFGIQHFDYEKVAISDGFDWYSKRVIDGENWLGENYTLDDIRKRKTALRKSNKAELEKIKRAQIYIEKFDKSPSKANPLVPNATFEKLKIAQSNQ